MDRLRKKREEAAQAAAEKKRQEEEQAKQAKQAQEQKAPTPKQSPQKPPSQTPTQGSPQAVPKKATAPQGDSLRRHVLEGQAIARAAAPQDSTQLARQHSSPMKGPSPHGSPMKGPSPARQGSPVKMASPTKQGSPAKLPSSQVEVGMTAPNRGATVGTPSPQPGASAASVSPKELTRRLGELSTFEPRSPGTQQRTSAAQASPKIPGSPRVSGSPRQQVAPPMPRSPHGRGTSPRQQVAPPMPSSPRGRGTPPASGSPKAIPAGGPAGSSTSGSPRRSPPTSSVQDISFVTGKPPSSSPTGSETGSSHRISPHSITPEEPVKPPVEYSGKSGRKVPVGTNYIRLETVDERGVFEYTVSFKPSVDSRDERFRLLKQLEHTIGKVRNFDGVKLVLPMLMESFKTTVTDANGSPLQAIVSYKATRPFGHLSVIQHFNLLFNKIMRVLKYSYYNRKHYNANAPIKIPKHKLEVWPGYVTAVDQYQGGLHLMLDVTHRVIRNENVKDILFALTKKGGASMNADAEKALLGMSVVTQYNNLSYKIDDIDWKNTPKSKFKRDRAGEGEITLIEYYKSRYNIHIKDPNQPLLVHRPKARSESEGEPRSIWLIPELCMMTGLTEAQRGNFGLMKDVAEHTRVTPEKRMQAMKKFIDNVNNNPEAKAILTNWGLKMSDNTAAVTARQLDSETLIFGRNQSERVTAKGDWNRAATNKEMLSTMPLNNWMVLYPKKDAKTVTKFLEQLVNAASKSGMKVKKPATHELPDDRTDSYLKVLKAQITNTTDLIMTIVPLQRADRYGAIKKLCCVERPIPSQVILTKTIMNEKRLMAVAQKVGIQLNCKLGGEAWGCATATKIKGLMTVGIDVYKDAVRRCAYVGLVATLNPALSKFHSSVALQKEALGSGGVANAVRPIFQDALFRYKQMNGSYPRNIVIYRDGGSDSEMDHIANIEAKQFLNAFDAELLKMGGTPLNDPIPKDQMPGFTYVVVQRRINTRIFGIKGNPEKPSGYENPACGIVLDHTVTRAAFKDFYLVPMSVSQGTATPTHFVVVLENEQTQPGGSYVFTPDHVQRLTYMLTHMYFNWPGTVRVPAPCQYARKLVDLVGEHLHQLPSDLLRNRLYYL